MFKKNCGRWWRFLMVQRMGKDFNYLEEKLEKVFIKLVEVNSNRRFKKRKHEC